MSAQAPAGTPGRPVFRVEPDIAVIVADHADWESRPPSSLRFFNDDDVPWAGSPLDGVLRFTGLLIFRSAELCGSEFLRELATARRASAAPRHLGTWLACIFMLVAMTGITAYNLPAEANSWA
jgi:hypothetical protein